MRRTSSLSLVSVILLGCSFPAAAQTADRQPEKVTAIHAANLIDGSSSQVRDNVMVVVRGNKIESVTEGGAAPAGAAVINLDSSTTVLPGMIDAHTHIFLQGEDPADGGYDV